MLAVSDYMSEEDSSSSGLEEDNNDVEILENNPSSTTTTALLQQQQQPTQPTMLEAFKVSNPLPQASHLSRARIVNSNKKGLVSFFLIIIT